MFVYCPQCGYIFKKGKEDSCPVCSHEITEVPAKYLSASKSFFASQDARQALTDEIAANPMYIEALAADKARLLAEKEKQHSEQVTQKVLEYKASTPALKCPVCGSTNLSIIPNLGKVVKISLIGVWGAGDLGKKRRCETCGHKF